MRLDWIVVCSAGEAAGMAIIVFAVSSVGSGWMLGNVAGAGALSGAEAGLCVGLATLGAVARMARDAGEARE